MDARHPSISLGVGGNSSIRRRSGAYSPDPASGQHDSHGPTRYSRRRGQRILSSRHPNPNRNLTVQVQDVDAVDNTPTVLLVRRPEASPFVPSLPNLRDRLASARAPPSIPHYSEWGSSNREVTDTFSSVPLTPRAHEPTRFESHASVDTTHTATSHISRLPTPEFTTDGPRTLLPRLFSLRRGVDRPSDPRPISARTDSAGSTTSESSTAVSACSAYSSGVATLSDTEHAKLLHSLSTTDKLTFSRKFPRPRSIRALGSHTGVSGRNTAFAATMLEEGEGLGIERPDAWTLHKWCLMVSVLSIFAYGTAGIVCAVLTWFRTWPQADVMTVADNDVLILLTTSASILLLTFIIGISGTLLNSRPLLAVYTLLLWPGLLSILMIGYTSYKRSAFALDRKLNLAWSEWYTPLGRLVIQDALHCCGFYNALHDATPSARCYPRTPLPGCKGALLRFEQASLEHIWRTVFSVVPLHIVNIVVALLCANHVTNMFGKGITPKQYRLSGADVRADAEKIMQTLRDVGPVVRPGISRAPSSVSFREDREETRVLHEEIELQPGPDNRSIRLVR